MVILVSNKIPNKPKTKDFQTYSNFLVGLRKPRDALGKGLGKPRESNGVPRKGSGEALEEALGEAWQGWGVLGWGS